MLKTRKLWVAAVALLAAVGLFIGCSSALDNVVVGDGTVVVPDTVAMKSFIENFSDYDTLKPASDGSARTILPDADTATYKYYLYGYQISNTKNYLDPTEMTLSGDVTTTTPVTFTTMLPTGNWEFVLYAVDSTKVPTITAATKRSEADANALKFEKAASLIARSYCALTSDSATCSFTLSPDKLTGEGIVNFKVSLGNEKADVSGADKYDPWDLPNGYTAQAEVQNLLTGAIISWASGTVTGDAKQVVFSTSGDGATKKNTDTFGGADQTLKPGTYNFVVRFMDDKSKEVYQWSDILVVLPNRSITTKEVWIPKMFDSIPGDVTSLKAVYYTNSEDEVDHEDSYKVHFQWDASDVVNEKYFEFELADLTEVAAAKATIADYDWSTEFTSFTPSGVAKDDDANCTGQIVTADDRYIKGSLLANNTDLAFYLKLGHKYTARIRAVNDSGASENWTVLTLPTGATSAEKITVTGVSDLSYFATPTGSAGALESATSINHYRITYNLNGGKYSRTASDYTGSNRIEYKVLDPSGAGYPIWNGTGVTSGVTGRIDYLSKDGQPLIFWVNDTYFNGSKDNTKDNTVYAKWLYWDNTGASPAAKWEKVEDKTKPELTDGTDYYLEPAATSGSTPDAKYKFDNPYYTDTKNITLYALYSGATGELTGSVTKVDETLYQLLASWINVTGNNNVATAVTKVTTADVASVTMKTTGDGANTKATFSLNIPGSATNPDNYDTITMVVKNIAENKILLISKKTGSELASDADFANIAFDTLDMGNGSYYITFTAHKAIADKIITRKVNITLTLTD